MDAVSYPRNHRKAHCTMAEFHCISTDEASRLLATEPFCVVDIRDPDSFAAGRLPGAQHLGNDNLQAFLADTDRSRPVLVCCYHGLSSQNAAQFLIEQGFDTVYSLDGGFEAWRYCGPVES